MPRFALLLVLALAASASAQTSRLVVWGSPSGGVQHPPVLGAEPAAQVAAGTFSSVVLREDGTVVVWGSADAPPAGLDEVVQVESGGATVARLADGTVRAWGVGPIVDDLPSGLAGVTQISVGDRRALALHADGTVTGWGTGDGVPPGLANVTQVSVGEQMAAALHEDGTVTSWPFSAPDGLDRVTQVAAGYDQVVALRDDGTVVAWGHPFSEGLDVPPGLDDVVFVAAWYESYAVRADGSVVSWNYTTAPPGLPPIARLDVGDDHVIAQTADGQVVTWGLNEFGQVPVPHGLDGIRAVSAGSFHALALREDRTVAAWGADTWGAASETPDDLGEVASIAAGDDVSIAIRTDGSVVSWGATWNGQRPPSGLQNAVQADTEELHSAVLFADGSVQNWGWDYDTSSWSGVTQIALTYLGITGLRADGTLVTVGSAPEPPPDLGPVVQISAGQEFVVGLLADGTVRAWGRNQYGQTDVPGDLADVVQVTAGSWHALALRSDGSVVSWGQSGPPPAGLMADAVSAGRFYSLALVGAVTVDAEPGTPSSSLTALRSLAPNPASGPVTVRYDLATPGPVLLDVLDLRGRRLATLAEGTRPAGAHEEAWDPGALPAGTYVVRLRAGGTVQARRVTVVR